MTCAFIILVLPVAPFKPSSQNAGHISGPNQVWRSVQQYAYWALGEYIHLWLDQEGLDTTYCYEFVAFHNPKLDRAPLAITAIMSRLLDAMWTEQGCLQLSATESLYKVASFAISLCSAGNVQLNTCGILSFIKHEFNAVLSSIYGLEQSYSSGNFMRSKYLKKYFCA